MDFLEAHKAAHTNPDMKLAIELALGICLPDNREDWPVGLAQTLMDCLQASHMVTAGDGNSTYGDLAREFISYLVAKNESRKQTAVAS